MEEKRISPAGNGARNGKDALNNTPIDLLLSRLDRVKNRGDGRWLACCPAHGDRTPSLSIRELTDGTLLVHCFAGCGFEQIVESVGLQPSDLFPPKPESQGPIRTGQRWVPRDVLEAVASEALVAAMAADAVRRGDYLNRADVDRVSKAATRLRAAAREVGHDC